MFCPYRYKIAYFLSHTGGGKKIVYINVPKGAKYNMLLGYCTLMLGIVVYMHIHLN